MLEVSAEFALNITFNRERIQKALPAGHLDATTLADYLVNKVSPIYWFVFSELTILSPIKIFVTENKIIHLVQYILKAICMSLSKFGFELISIPPS